MKRYILTLMAWTWVYTVLGQTMTNYPLKGLVLDETNQEPLPGALISVQNGAYKTVTDQKGTFALSLPEGIYHFEISYLGFQTKEIELKIPSSGRKTIYMVSENLSLQQVEVVSTGYQKVPRERATGSFAYLNEDQLNRRVSLSVLDRLEDMTPGLIFNRDGERDPISIRGRSTIHAEVQPLIIVDNFPYDGPLDNINPNDVESITVLRDAAAASVWGARAGNGVIVITTKKGALGQRPQVSFNSNLTFTEKPDPFYLPKISIPDFVDLEKQLFEQGLFESAENSVSKQPLSPVVETLIAHRDGKISEQEAASRLEYYKQQDNRHQLSDLVYRPALNSQSALSIRGGGNLHRYSFSLGYDQNRNSLPNGNRKRLTLNAQNQWSLLDNKLNLSTGMYYVNGNTVQGTAPNLLYPYESLVDELGNPLAVTQGYSIRFLEDAEGQGLMDWSYYPLREQEQIKQIAKQQGIRLIGSVDYGLSPHLKAGVSYQFWNNDLENRNLREEQSYFARDMVNRFTQVEPDGTIFRPVPLGAVLDLSNGKAQSHTFRAQLNYNRQFAKGNRLDALLGYEIKRMDRTGAGIRYYGYDDDLGLSSPIDGSHAYRLNHSQTLVSIPSGISHEGIADRFVSYFTNLAYTLRNNYIFSASARKDRSNLFGVDSNRKGVPLWSVGGSWLISGEQFYKLKWMPYLRLRATYGYNGNIDKSLSAYTTASYSISSSSLVPNLRQAVVTNPPNPDLQWERIKIINLGLDFETKNGRFSGYIEGFHKRGLDLIGDIPMVPSSGVNQFRGNFASTKSKGLDLMLTTTVLDKAVLWKNTFLFSHIQEEVTDYGVNTTQVTNYLTAGLIHPVIGKPLHSVFTIPWAGLDRDTGNPLGILDGEPSMDYAAIFNTMALEDLDYKGTVRPRFYGAFRNDIQWKGFALSVNISYRLGYFYRRNSLSYLDVLEGRMPHSDYYLRWQQPGDEQKTMIPSFPDAYNSNREAIFRFSEALIERGDHIRLQDIRLSYTLDKIRMTKLPFKRAELYTYANNLGILWKAAKNDPLDPDFRSSRPLKSIALGLKIDF
ncbi:SusC/RagA family TonB-linked outer membrane protein [Echinicola shivajiensis]|uniref:SusC/RagA family TonB-linked outer membrane protein n=1 Tax=Echinicola shivajiensis TaxID=1035916 RepID=UPI001BFCBDE8|nr:SusC/RagA family TonB-linked outer membrane protein [Echinicola shivajiensis]